MIATAELRTTAPSTRRTRTIKLDGGELRRDALPRPLRDLSDAELKSRLVIGYAEPLRIATTAR